MALQFVLVEASACNGSERRYVVTQQNRDLLDFSENIVMLFLLVSSFAGKFCV